MREDSLAKLIFSCAITLSKIRPIEPRCRSAARQGFFVDHFSARVLRMNRLFWMLMGIGLGAGVAYYSSQNYLVHGASGYELVPRSATGFNDAYVDTRHFTFSDWFQHPELAADIAKSNKTHLLPGVQSMQNTINSQAPAAQKAW